MLDKILEQVKGSELLRGVDDLGGSGELWWSLLLKLADENIMIIQMNRIGQLPHLIVGVDETLYEQMLSAPSIGFFFWHSGYFKGLEYYKLENFSTQLLNDATGTQLANELWKIDIAMRGQLGNILKRMKLFNEQIKQLARMPEVIRMFNEYGIQGEFITRSVVNFNTGAIRSISSAKEPLKELKKFRILAPKKLKPLFNVLDVKNPNEFLMSQFFNKGQIFKARFQYGRIRSLIKAPTPSMALIALGTRLALKTAQKQLKKRPVDVKIKKIENKINLRKGKYPWL